MARPDDNHEPRTILGDNGEVLAIAHVSPDITPEGEAALRAVVDAARRMHDQLPAEERAAMAERQRAAIARVRERTRRLHDPGALMEEPDLHGKPEDGAR